MSPLLQAACDRHIFLTTEITMNHETLNSIARYMQSHGETLAVAESVTAGNLQAALSLADGTLNFFQGGITAYNIGQKTRHLNIDPIHADSCNSVSEKVAQRMALAVAGMFTCDWGIGVTGYAAPVPERNVATPFCHFAFSYQGTALYTRTLEARPSSIATVQLFYVQAILDDFFTYLQSRP